MASINDAMDNLTKTITLATGLRCGPWADTINPPCAQVWVEDFDGYYEAFKRGVVNIPLMVQVLVGSVGERAGAQLLNDYVSPSGPKSIPQAVYQHPTLGTSKKEDTADPATKMTASVASLSNWGPVQGPDGVRYLGAQLRILVQVRGDS